MVPVTAVGADGRYVSDLRKDDFTIFENDTPQNVVLFGGVSEPVSVVLLLDTSTSTQDKLGEIRRAALGFVNELQTHDRVKLITFDDQVTEVNDFTADRAGIKAAILKAHSGYGTKFYDAMNVALESVKEIDGRKAIVIFSDGVDYRSDYASAESTQRSLEDEGVVVYPIRFNTRVAAEKLAREQAGPALPTREVVKSTSPSPEPQPQDSDPTRPGSGRTGTLGLPSPAEILISRRRESGRDRAPTADGRPPAGEIGADVPVVQRRSRGSSRGSEKAPEDSIGLMLDRLYGTADSYMKALADKSGGQLLRADDVTTLPAAFAQVASELRTQYWLGYPLPDGVRPDQYRLIKVTTTRPGVIVRARPGYRGKG
jgi:VWFA-related protein